MNLLIPYYIGLGLLGIATATAIFRFKKYRSRFTFYFLIFLIASSIFESIGWYIKIILVDFNQEVYFIYSFFEFNLIALMYASIIEDKKVLGIIKVFAVVFNISYITGWIIDQEAYYESLIILESIFMSVIFISYFRELLNSDKILNFTKYLPFWITTGLMIYFLSSIPFQFIREDLSRKLNIIQPVINYLMYSCFIYAFLWSKEETSY